LIATLYEQLGDYTFYKDDDLKNKDIVKLIICYAAGNIHDIANGNGMPNATHIQ